MAKVLRSKRSETVACDVSSGGRYMFLVGRDHGSVGGLELIMDDKHAEELLSKYDFLEVVPTDKWPDRYKAKVAEYQQLRIKEAAELFPEMAHKVLEPVKEAVKGKGKEG